MTSIEKITLHHGPLEFTALTAGEGPLVLCLHGFPDNAGSYRHQLPVLAKAGYRAVSVTLRGYEPGSQPADGDYAVNTIATDIIAFLDELDVEKAHLVGHDWGAAITYMAGAMAPQRFTSLTTMSVPHSGRFLNDMRKHPKQLRLSWYMGFFQLRGISDFVVRRNEYQFIRKLWRDWSPGWELPENALADVIATLHAPGVTKAALSYYRTAMALKNQTRAAKAAALSKVPVPTLAITGERDGCIDSEVFKSMMYKEDFPGGLEMHQIAEAGHFPHQEQPDAVNKLLLDWIGRWEEAS